MAQQSIYCSVESCHYWKNGNICDANEIMVTSDEVGSSQPDSFDAPLAASVAATPVNTCMETCCKTFVKKGSNKTNVDNVYKK